MVRIMEVRIGEWTFPTKRAAVDRIRAALYAVRPGENVRDEDVPFVLALLERHPRHEQKIGVGVRRVFVRFNEYKSAGFWVERIDDTRTDFSFNECLRPADRWTDFRRAMRWEVRDQIEAFRARAFAGNNALVCPLTGDTVTRTTAHVDHCAPDTFDALAVRFVAIRDWRVVPLVSHDGMTGDRIDDVEFVRLWRAYHAEHAVLRLLSVRGNLSDARRVTP